MDSGSGGECVPSDQEVPPLDLSGCAPGANDYQPTVNGSADDSFTYTLAGDDDAIRFDVGLVTGNYLSVMGLAPILGRPFDERDDGAAAAPVLCAGPISRIVLRLVVSGLRTEERHVRAVWSLLQAHLPEAVPEA